MAQKLSRRAASAKKKRDLAFAKSAVRKRKKAENQRLRRAAKKAGKSLKVRTMIIKEVNLSA